VLEKFIPEEFFGKPKTDCGKVKIEVKVIWKNTIKRSDRCPFILNYIFTDICTCLPLMHNVKVSS